MVLALELTYSLPVQKLDASLANHAMAPRSSSGRPIRPTGFELDHLSRSCSSLSRNAAVILFALCKYSSNPNAWISLTLCRNIQEIVCLPVSSLVQVRRPCYGPSEESPTCWYCKTPLDGPEWGIQQKWTTCFTLCSPYWYCKTPLDGPEWGIQQKWTTCFTLCSPYWWSSPTWMQSKWCCLHCRTWTSVYQLLVPWTERH